MEKTQHQEVQTQASEPTHVMDLVYYDGPLISAYKSETGQPVLRIWIDCTSEYNEYVLLTPSVKDFFGLLENKVSFHDVCSNAVEIIRFKQYDDDRIVDLSHMSNAEYMEAFGPDEDAKLFFDNPDEAFAAEIKRVMAENFPVLCREYIEPTK